MINRRRTLARKKRKTRRIRTRTEKTRMRMKMKMIRSKMEMTRTIRIKIKIKMRKEMMMTRKRKKRNRKRIRVNYPNSGLSNQKECASVVFFQKFLVSATMLTTSSPLYLPTEGQATDTTSPQLQSTNRGQFH